MLIGSPKEMASFKLMRIFDIEKISICVFDDADIVNTTALIKEQITRQLKCQKILVSSTSIAGATKYVGNLTMLLYEQNVKVEQYFLNCGDPSVKFKAILNIFHCLIEKNLQAIIFVQVSVSH